jgi:aconitate hydratase
LPAPLAQAITANRLVATAVLSGNRNFDGRIHPSVRAAYLASPPLVVAYALAGTLRIDLTQDSLGTDQSGHPVFLRDLWPADGEVAEAMAVIEPGMYRRSYAHVFEGDAAWASIARTGGTLFDWKPGSTYFRRPPYFDGLGAVPPPPADLRGMRPLAILGDFVATDHLAPNGAIPADSPAGRYLAAGGVAEADFNTYGARRSNFEIGIRSAAANARLQNRMVPGTEGGVTRLMPDGTVHSVFDAATTYLERAVPLVIVAGRDYGAGSSRDWAAKGVSLLGVKSVIAESFERIHRANLIGTGVLPVRLPEGTVVDALGLDGSECYDLTGIAGAVVPGQVLRLVIRHGDGRTRELDVTACIETPDEAECLRHGGILPMVYRELVAAL